MSDPVSTSTPPARWLALDVFRGLAVIGMMLVDWTGSWDTRYAVFEHAKWLGITPPDFIFPSLLFIAGVSISLSLPAGPRTGRRAIYLRILRRSLLLFLLGYALNVFWDWEPGYAILAKTRLMGVLQRYALVYPIVALLQLRFSLRGLALVTAGILAGYAVLLLFVPVPGFGTPDLALCPEGGTMAPNLATWVDKIVLGARAGAYYPHDPEGLLTTVPAVATTLLGAIAGRWLRSGPGEEGARRERLFVAGMALVIAGYLASMGLPLSKKLWTSSFVLFTGGFAILALASLIRLVDVEGRTRWTALPRFYGSNALAAIVLFTLLDNLLRVLPVGRRADQRVYALKDFIYERLLGSWLPPRDAAWVYSALGILLLGLGFRALYRRRLFLRA
jgi:predicted acyltransferase